MTASASSSASSAAATPVAAVTAAVSAGASPMASELSQSGLWTEVIRDEGIVVFKRPRAQSPYEEVRAETRMDAQLDDFLPYFSQPDSYKKWVYGNIDSRLVTKSGENDLVFYSVFKIPWPFENREIFCRNRISRPDAGQLSATLSLVDSELPVGKGLVRVTRFESNWRVKSAPEGKVDFSIEMYAEPGGNLPPFVVNLVLSRIQLWSMKNLRGEIQSAKK